MTGDTKQHVLGQSSRHAVGPAWVASLTIIVATLFVAALGLTAPPQARATVEKGIIEPRFHTSGGFDPDRLQGMVEQIGPENLGARWTRVVVYWRRLQPVVSPGTPDPDDADGDGYSDSYVAQLDEVITRLHDAGLKIVMTGLDVPRWASDSRYWTKDGYDTDVVMRIDDPIVRRQFSAFGRFLASRYAATVHHFEVWNEPNLGSGMYPQRTAKALVALPVYVKMLKAFAAGVRSGAPGTCVIAGATAPRGANDRYSTSPQVFARYLSDHKTGKWFDAYSHHPYTPRGSRNASPNLPPNNPTRCVTLYNLKTLLDEFPGKPFYLTEFAYDTEYSEICGLKVSRADQARYLRAAYKRVARWRQIKALFWYLVVDSVPYPDDPARGLYLGLIEKDGMTRKPAWYAYAGSNSLTITAPRSAAAGAVFTIAGALSTKLGPLEGVKLTLQARSPSRSRWSNRSSATTEAEGHFSFAATQARSRKYRVVWDGVCESVARTIATP